MSSRDQFEDAFEDAESDHQSMKILAPKDSALQSNGHVVQGIETGDVNGDLPESESADYQMDHGRAAHPEEQNGGYDDEDEYYEDGVEEGGGTLGDGGPEAQHQREGEQSGDELGQGVEGDDDDDDQYQEQYEEDRFQEPEDYEGSGYAEEATNQHYDPEVEPRPAGEGGQYKESDQYTEDQYYDKDGGYEGNQGYTEEDQYYAEEEEPQYDGGDAGDEQQQQQYGVDENQLNDAGRGLADDQVIDDREQYGGDYIEGNDAYEYTEDDAYNHVSYANHKEDSPPEDVSESDQFIDNPDIDEFKPAAVPFGFPTREVTGSDDLQYEFHDPDLKEGDGVYEDSGIVSGENSTDQGNAHHSDVDLDIPSNQEMEKGSPLAEEDSKIISHEQLATPHESEGAGTTAKNEEAQGVEHLQEVSRMKDENKIESDSTEADQQREVSKEEAIKPGRPVALSPSKTGPSMQYKESKELESILHSNLNALISQKVKVEEEVADPSPPQPQPQQEVTADVKTKKEPNQAIPKHVPPKSARSPGASVKASPQSRPQGGTRKQAGARAARGRVPPGSRPPNRGRGNESRGMPPTNRGRRPDKFTGGGERQEVVAGGKGPGSAKPVSALKTMVQSARQDIQDLDNMLVASTENSADEREKQLRSPDRVQRRGAPEQKGNRHSMEYAAPADVLQERSTGLPEEPRNNSNGNHLRRSNNRKKQRRPQSAYYPSAYSRNIEESLSTPGEVVFDDIAECSAYLQEKEHSMGQRSRSDVGPRRRRNSYEMANRESSEEEENAPFNPYFASSNLIPGGVRSNHEVFARLEDDYGADDSGNADDLPDSTQPSVTSDVSTPSTPGSQSNGGSDQRAKLPPGINPLEYDVVGLRLAEPLDDSTMSLSSGGMSAQPVPDQFSDADEEDGAVATTATSPTMVAQNQLRSASSPVERSSPRRPEKVTPQATPPSRQPRREVTKSPKSSPPLHKSPPRQVDIGKTMEELKSISETSRSAMSKVPTFYVPEDTKSSPWVLQPGVAMEQEKLERDRRRKIEMQRREQEYHQIQRRQREELHQKRDPQCYMLRDEDEDTDSESRNLMDADQRQPMQQPPQQQQRKKTTSSAEMRAPDLPPTTGKIKEARGPHDEKDLKSGIRYQAAYLGSTQLITTKQPTRKVRMQQAQEAVNRIKAPEGEEQPSKEVDLAISNERIQVLNADSQETMMDHPLKTISYIADIGNIVVIMARRRSVKTLDEAVEESGVSVDGEGKRQPRKIICHVFETEDAQLIAQTIGQAFALAYLEFLKVNGIDDAHVHEMDYHDVLNSQEIYGDDLMLFSNKECEKEALVEKVRGEIMGMVIVESGWGSLIPTVVVANMSPFGAAARSGKLNIGDQIMAINGTSLVGLPLGECQNVIKSLKSQALVKFNIVSCPPVTQVLIKRPDTKYQLGFSVQNGIICSLMRGGIAERGGVRVGHRIIEINGTSVVATPHEKIVDLLSTSVGEMVPRHDSNTQELMDITNFHILSNAQIRMKTMPLSMYKLLTGQEQPVYI